MGDWFLEGYFGDDDVLTRLPLQRFPFQVGRQKGLDFTVKSDDVSRVHAELAEKAGEICVRDLDSTNGTFVNHKIIDDTTTLRHGDVIHFANIECRIINDAVPSRGDTGYTRTVVGAHALSSRFPTGVGELQEMIEKREIVTAFQGIFDARTESLMAYEVLGRGGHPHLPSKPLELFRIAASVGLEVELSELLRDGGVAFAVKSGVTCSLFLNTHPSEMRDIDRLLEALSDLRDRYPESALVLEIHEQSVSDIDTMRIVKQELKSLHMQLAYDDFGAGQARLLELVDASPDYLKFDMALIRDIDKASSTKLQLLQALRDMAHDINVTTVAEGVSRAGEARACRALGFDLIQGFYYHRPTMRLPAAPLPANRDLPSDEQSVSDEELQAEQPA